MRPLLLPLILLSAALPLAAQEVDLAIGTGGQWSRVKSTSTLESKTDLVDWMAHIQGRMLITEKFFIGGKWRLSLTEQNRTEAFYRGGLRVQENNLSLSENTLEIHTGYQILAIFKPFVGLSYQDLNVERSDLGARPRVFDQEISDLDYLLGIEGLLEFNDYLSMGYTMKYQGAADNEVVFGDHTFRDVPARKWSSEVFLQYWLPNEIFQIGLHFYGGQSLYDEERGVNTLLPETDIRFFGAFLKFNARL